MSLIIPNRNCLDLLERCLDSVPRRDDIQIIVVDDASDPKVVDFEKYRSLADEHVEIIFTTEGLGAGYARNVGLRHAHGKWLMFLDSDDFLLPSALDLIDRYSASESDIKRTVYRMLNSNKKLIIVIGILFFYLVIYLILSYVLDYSI